MTTVFRVCLFDFFNNTEVHTVTAYLTGWNLHFKQSDEASSGFSHHLSDYQLFAIPL